ncbi:VolA/Pla-1 family phospholipase [Vibrio sp. SCSIO 43136]|uniref:VolA/Pla-1 family phospholipase n=1 Tax=Vibrio sp. SCSIO 43136 TaxID=2819101 RepID=UPI002074F397|nr:VolA/Pla-1 family phospholipase [Vibrio sp. SCSIO 43136]USD66774.1 lipase [Vibrio sp. SCSIO 43136]
MKRSLTLLASAVILAGCGDNSESSGKSKVAIEAYLQALQSRATTIDFQLSGANAWVPPPSVLLRDTQDGTLALPTGTNPALSNPYASMNTADGWGITTPISLRFDGAGFTANTVITSGIYIFQLSGGLTDSTPPTITGQITNFTAVTSGDSINIVFAEPLDEKTNYIFALTDDIVDKNGDPVGTSSSYATLKSSQVSYPSGDLASAQQVVKGVEQYMAGASIDATKIVYSTWFSTQSVGDSLYATKGAIATGIDVANIGAVWKDGANPNSVDLSSAYTFTFGTSEDFATALNTDTNFNKYIADDDTDAATKKAAILASYTASTVTVTKGSVALPYFLENSATTFGVTPFASAMPSLALISNNFSDSVIQSQLAALGINSAADLADPTKQAALIGQTLTKSDGSQLDSERVVTQYAPVPQIKSLQNVPFLLFTPTTPTGNFPIVVYSHGITSAKENAYAFAKNLAAQGIGLIVIDHPIHGERAIADSLSANSNILNYLNLSYLAVARDNIRQSILDTMGLRAALTYQYSSGSLVGTALANLDNPVTNAPRFLGHSLGGITGFSSVAVANQTLNNASGDALFTFGSATIANSGGQIGNLLLASASYGPLIKHNLASAASTKYATYAAESCTSLSGAACYSQFESLADAATLATLEAGFNSFIYAAQTVIDTVDPISMAYRTTSFDSLPALFIQSKDDDTVPNSVSTAPFAGTTPLATKVTPNVANSGNLPTNQTQLLVQFNNTAQHSTFVSPQSDTTPLPADYYHHTEMQRQIVDFFADNSLATVDNSNSVFE